MNAKTLTLVPRPAVKAALFYGDDAHLRRNKTVESLRDIGIDACRLLLAKNAARVDAKLDGVDVVVVIRDQISRDDASAVEFAARTMGKPVFSIMHRKSDPTWRTLEAWVSGGYARVIVDKPAPVAAPVPPQPATPVATRSTYAEMAAKMAQSAEEDAALAAMYLEDNVRLEKEKAELQDRLAHVVHELTSLRQQISTNGVVAREQMAADLARAHAERKAAVREAEDLKARLEAAETLRRNAESPQKPSGKLPAIVAAWRAEVIDAQMAMAAIEKALG